MIVAFFIMLAFIWFFIGTATFKVIGPTVDDSLKAPLKKWDYPIAGLFILVWPVILLIAVIAGLCYLMGIAVNWVLEDDRRCL